MRTASPVVSGKVVVSKINTDVDPTNDALKIAGEFINATAFNTLKRWRH